MDSKRISSLISVKYCSLCREDTEFYCQECNIDLCRSCKNIHVIDLDTRSHVLTIYAEKFKISPNQVIFARCRNLKSQRLSHINNNQSGYNHEPCENRTGHPFSGHVFGEQFQDSDANTLCEVSVYDAGCVQRSLPPLEQIRHYYEIKRRQYSEKIFYIRSETLYNMGALLAGLKFDLRTGHEEVLGRGRDVIINRVQELKELIDSVLVGNLQNRYILQKARINKCITGLSNLEHKYERIVNRPVKYLRFLTKNYDSQRDKKTIVNNVVKLLKEIKITSTGIRSSRNEIMLKLMFPPLLQKSFIVTDVNDCDHISCESPDRIWVSDCNIFNDVNNLVLTDTTGAIIYTMKDICGSGCGFHTVNHKCELIYIDKNCSISKLSKDRAKTTKFIEISDDSWKPRCVYCSQFSGNLLVGMWRRDEVKKAHEGKITRYNSAGKLIQTIPNDNTPNTQFRNPLYITENNNGNVVVSDFNRVLVVTDRGGRHRFSYKGPPSGSGLWLWGICTDALSHILVCDRKTQTVQMLNKDGQFLSFLLTRNSPGLHNAPRGLSYDSKNHLLLVGSLTNKRVSVYRYIHRHHYLTN